jgi:hypothetical protein
LGKFSLIGQWFILASFLTITNEAQNFVQLFSSEKVHNVLIFAKKGLGYFLGDVFTNPSGHPGS